MKWNLLNWKKGYRLLLRFKRIVGVLILALVVFYFLKSPSPKTEEYFLVSEGSIIKLDLEIAKTPLEITKGLSNRDYLAKYNGMLFEFGEPKTLKFWMKDTRLSLDLFYLDKDLVIKEIHTHLTPYSEKIIKSKHHYSYALELNAGFAEYHNIKINDKLIKSTS